ncbi:Latisemin [Dactylella cylindrospora]|nr:Latisemin [Dactylella cylindrospora]
MKGVVILLVSALTSFVTVGLSATIPITPRNMIVGPACEVVNNQIVWDDALIDPHNGTNPIPTPSTPSVPAIEARQASPTPTAYTSREGKFSRDMLKITNDLRAIHNSPPVIWNKELATYASRQGRKCNFKHSGGPYGENLAGGGPMNNPVWYQWYLYSEVNNYDWNKPGFSKATGHFTQLVWSATREMGCAWIAGCSNLSYQVWCEFKPAGNVAPVINYVNNVGRPRRGLPSPPPTYDPHYK